MAIRIGTFGNDTLDGTRGRDILIGLFGDDTYNVTPGDVVLETPRGGTDTVVAGFSTTLGANLENLTLSGLADIDGTGNELDNVILGTSASNVLHGGGGNDWLYGGNGGDEGIYGLDTVYGDAGNDTIVFDSDDINGRSGAGVVYDGGAGFDTLYFGVGEGGSLNLASTTFDAIQSIERFDLSGTQANSILFTPAYIARMSPETRRVLVDGDALDSVGTVPDADWYFERFVDIDGNRYADYSTQGAAPVRLRVDVDIDRSGISVVNPPDESGGAGTIAARADAFASLVGRMMEAQHDPLAGAPATVASQIQAGRGTEPQLAGGG
jgi:hypothetical protein